ncbi:hypothetical protein CCR97_02050, partial [Rhodoplanes elegans]
MSVSSISSSTSTELLKALYSTLDADKSGGVSLGELTTASDELAGTSATDATKLFESADTDSDGLLSESEVKTAFESLSSDMRTTLLAVQEMSSETATAGTLAALVSDAAEEASASSTADDDSGTSSSDAVSGSGGGGGGGAAATSEEESGPFDAADTNQDGEVSAAEQAAWDAAHAAAEETAEP